MYFIGIDISKYKHDCFIMNDNRDVIRDSFSFDNSREGFDTLLSIIKSLDSSQKIKIGLEATGHYGDNLKSLLNDNNLSFMEINPLLVKRYIQNQSLRKEKNDKADARWIAKYIASPDHNFKSYQFPSYHIKRLKSLTRFRESLVKTRSSYIVMIINILDVYFPEFIDFFNGKLTDTALFILKKYKSPLRISKFSRDDMVACHNKSKVISTSRFEELKFLAKNSIGMKETYLSNQLSIVIDLYLTIDTQITNLENEIEQIMIDNPNPLDSLRGLSTTSKATLIGEFGDIARFNSASQMIAFAGLDCSRSQSGTEDHHGKMVKHGSPHIRYVLFNAVRPLKLFNPIFNTYYIKKLIEGKPRRIAECHTAKKLIRIIYHLFLLNIPFDSEKLK